MHVTQDLNSFWEIIAHAHCSVDEKKYIYIFCVYHIRIIAKKYWFTRHETNRFLNNHCQRENRIIWSQIVCDLLLKSAFEWIFNVMQLILVKIKWHIKWKYLIKKFHDICLSYYFKQNIVFRKYYLQFYKNCISISIRNIINLLYLDTYCIFLGEIDVEIEMCMFIVIVMVM
jgi:hypothetical protein